MLKVLFVLSLFFSTSVYAGWASDHFSVTYLVMEGSENQPLLNIALSPNPKQSDTACTDNTFVTMPTASEKGKQMLSLLMMAAASNKKILINVNGCFGGGARPLVKDIWLIN